jgi:hypothetical protein
MDTSMTTNEKNVLCVMIFNSNPWSETVNPKEWDLYDDFFESHICIKEICKRLNQTLKANEIKGVVSSLVKKNLITNLGDQGADFNTFRFYKNTFKVIKKDLQKAYADAVEAGFTLGE